MLNATYRRRFKLKSKLSLSPTQLTSSANEMSKTADTPEEELEKQYRDYKAQFEQWKEKNKGSEGTEGYIKYVKDFEKWEKEVEQRRIAVRNKSEQDRKQTGDRSVTATEDQQPQDEASVAARYAREQQQYTSMHMRGIQDQERQQAIQRQKHRPANPNQNFTAVPPPDQQHLHTNSHYQIQPLAEAPVPLMSLNPRPVDQFELSSSIEEAIRNGPHIRADPQPSGQQLPLSAAIADEPRPMLWGPEGADYLPTDAMFLKWGLRALPPNLKTPYVPPRSDAPITPCWYLMNKMQEKGLFYGHNVNLIGAPELITQPISNYQPVQAQEKLLENGHHPVQNGVKEHNVEIPDFSRPPPLFDPSRPPPSSLPQFNSNINSNIPVVASGMDPIQFNVPPPSAPFQV